MTPLPCSLDSKQQFVTHDGGKEGIDSSTCHTGDAEGEMGESESKPKKEAGPPNADEHPEQLKVNDPRLVSDQMSQPKFVVTGSALFL